MSTTAAVLDGLLPLVEPRRPELHANAALLEVSDAALLVELASDSKVRPYLVARLSDTVALIDPGRAEELARALRDAGHTPKRVRGPAG